MLILTRRVGETIRINDDIKVTVTEVQGGQVKIGIAAPAHVQIHRQEIYDRIQSQAENPHAHPRVAGELQAEVSTDE